MGGRADTVESGMDPLDVDALSRFVRERAGANAVHDATLERLSGGAIQENYRLQVTLEGGTLPGTRAFVVRRDAPSRLPVSLARSEEFAVMKAAYEAGVKVPNPYWISNAAGQSDDAFYVMQFVEGSAAPFALTKQDFTPQQRRHLVFELGQEIAKLHRVRPPQAALSFLPIPDTSPAHRRIAECRHLLDRMNEAQPALEHMLCWLEDHVPAKSDCVLCHGDFRTGNYLVRDAGLMAILDWEFAGWSDPYEDLGWMCARSWRFRGPQHEAGGVGSVADLMDGYKTILDHEPDLERLAYWEVMASVRWAVIALLQAHRHLSGKEESLELLLTGYMAPEIQCDGLTHLREADPAVYPGTAADTTQPLPDMSAFAQPSVDANLLRAARGALVDAIMPLLPEACTYEARMVAHAIAMAERGITDGPLLRAAMRAAITRFYADMGRPPPPNGAEVAGLARDIRRRLFPVREQQCVTSLVEHLLQLLLCINNPKRVRRA